MPHSALLQASPIARALTRFLRWWGNELAALLPEQLRTWWSASGQIVLLAIDAHGATFERAVAGQRERIHFIELDRDRLDTQGAEASRILTQRAGANFRPLLSIPSALTLRRALSLPLATEENLGQTLAFELDRYTPLKPDQAYFDFRVRRRDEAQRRIEVDLAVARRSDVEPMIQTATALGLAVEGLAFEGEVLGGAQPVASSAARAQAGGGCTRWRIGLSMLTVGLLIALLAIPVWQKRSAAIALLAPLAEAKQAALETDRLREQLDKLANEHNALPAKKWAAPSLTVILDALSKRLKDDTFLTHFNFEGKSVSLQGESAAAADLIEVLEAAPLFQNVAFGSPLTKTPGTAYDRFHIRLDLSPEGLPKPPASEGATTP